MLSRNKAGQGVYLYAVDTTAAPYGPKRGDAANITGSITKDGGARAAFGTTHPTEIDATNMPGVYWQPTTQGETDFQEAAASWQSTTSGVFIQPVFLESASAVWDEINTGATHNLNNSTGKQLRALTAGGSTGVIYSETLPSQVGMTATQFQLSTGASNIAQIYRWNVISVISGTGAGQSAVITDYTTSRIGTVTTPWVVQPDATSFIEITPTATVTVVNYIAGQDPATWVWGAATRTLTTLPSIPSNWITAAGITAGALNGKGDWLTTLGTNAPANWINAASIATAALNGKGDWLTSASYVLPLDAAGTRAALGMASANLDTQLTSIMGGITTIIADLGSVGTPLDAAGTRAALGMASANLDTQLSAIKSDTGSLVISVGALPSAVQTADALLGRNISGGGDGGRTVSQAMHFLRNRWIINAGVLTVYATNDSTPSWTATVVTSPSNPVVQIDPA